MDCSVTNPCVCMAVGYLKPACGPKQYRWAIDRLVEEFGETNVRVGWEHDYGRTQKVAVCFDDWKEKLLVQILMGPHPTEADRWYDINDNRSDLDAFIERVRSVHHGLGA